MRARVLGMGTALVAGAVAMSPGLATTEPGPWVWPLTGPHTVGRPFDPPATRYGPGHRGADLLGVVGQSVRAAGAGRVSYAGMLAGRGVLVVVHGDLRTTYEPVTAVVRVGDQVAAGQVIGRLAAGHPGCTPACVHWGLLRGTVYLDPVRLVRRGPSRLLPVDDAVPAGGHTPPVDSAARPAAQPAGVESAAPEAPHPADGPTFALRSGDAASAGAALAALVAGLILVRRPPRPPDRPVAPALPAPADLSPRTVSLVEPHADRLVDLAAERHRRRPDVA